MLTPTHPRTRWMNRPWRKPTRDWRPVFRATTSLRERSHGGATVPTVFWDDACRQGTRQRIAAQLELDG